MNPLAFLAPVTKILGGWLGHKARMAEAKRSSELRIEEKRTDATIRRIDEGDAHAARLDEVSLKTRGWKDEYLLLLATIPVIMSFVPDWSPHAVAGFAALAKLPEWYKWVLLGVYIDTFGFRRMLRQAMEHWINKRMG